MNLRNFLPQWLFQDFFLSWGLQNWQEIYKNQTNLLEINCGEYSRVLPQVIAFDNTDKRFELDQIRFQLISREFQIKETTETEKLLRLYKRFSWIHKRKLFNDACLKLNKISENSEYVIFQLQKSGYFDYICTNLCLDAQLTQRSKSLRTKIHIEQHDHQLEDLADSPLANILGINILIFTSDDTLILQKRSSRTLIRPNQICSSVSGTITKQDIPFCNEEFTLERLLPSFFREMFEELGLSISILSKENVIFLGVIRELIRGGQPEMFLSARINLTKTEVMQAYTQALDKFESKSLLFFNIGLPAAEILDTEDKKSLFRLKVSELVQQYEQDIAVPLWANLALWCKAKLNPY